MWFCFSFFRSRVGSGGAIRSGSQHSERKNPHSILEPQSRALFFGLVCAISTPGEIVNIVWPGWNTSRVGENRKSKGNPTGINITSFMDSVFFLHGIYIYKVGPNWGWLGNGKWEASGWLSDASIVLGWSPIICCCFDKYMADRDHALATGHSHCRPGYFSPVPMCFSLYFYYGLVFVVVVVVVIFIGGICTNYFVVGVCYSFYSASVWLNGPSIYDVLGTIFSVFLFIEWKANFIYIEIYMGGYSKRKKYNRSTWHILGVLRYFNFGAGSWCFRISLFPFFFCFFLFPLYGRRGGNLSLKICYRSNYRFER